MLYYSSSLITINKQHNWYTIHTNYQNYFHALLRISGLLIILIYLQSFILVYIAFLCISSPYNIYRQNKDYYDYSKLAIVVSREQIYTYIQLKEYGVWHNADYLHGYALFNQNLIIISVNYDKKQYTYIILKFGIPKILFENLRKNLYYLMFYSQIKKYN
jgi:hypothetical protein